MILMRILMNAQIMASLLIMKEVTNSIMLKTRLEINFRYLIRETM